MLAVAVTMACFLGPPFPCYLILEYKLKKYKIFTCIPTFQLQTDSAMKRNSYCVAACTTESSFTNANAFLSCLSSKRIR